MVDLVEAGIRLGYSPEYLRKLMKRDDPPPFFKNAGGQWRGWLSDLDAWAERAS